MRTSSRCAACWEASMRLRPHAVGSISGVIKTKISGTTVSLDTAALNAVKSAVAITYVERQDRGPGCER